MSTTSTDRAVVGASLLAVVLGATLGTSASLTGPLPVKPTDPPAATATPEAAPTVTPGPAITVTSVVDIRSASAEQHLTGGSAIAPDGPPLDHFTGGLIELIELHLADLQSGQGGRLAAIALPGLLPTPETTLLAGMASPEAPAATADVRVRIEHDGGPLWASVTLVTTGTDGRALTATLVFTPSDRGDPVLVAISQPVAVTQVVS